MGSGLAGVVLTHSVNIRTAQNGGRYSPIHMSTTYAVLTQRNLLG